MTLSRNYYLKSEDDGIKTDDGLIETPSKADLDGGTPDADELVEEIPEETVPGEDLGTEPEVVEEEQA